MVEDITENEDDRIEGEFKIKFDLRKLKEVKPFKENFDILFQNHTIIDLLEDDEKVEIDWESFHQEIKDIEEFGKDR